MALRLEGYIDLPEHAGPGGFDHAAVHRGLRRLYVAHTANDALDVIDLDAGRYVDSIPGLTGVAGALVDEASGTVFTSNRGEDTVSIFDARAALVLDTVPVGKRPNGLAFDPGRATLLVANVGDPADPASHTLSVIGTQPAAFRASVRVPGRTRWTVFDADSDRFFVNIADPASIVVLAGGDPARVSRTIPIPAVGPHGLDLDAAGRLYCACDEGRLVVLAPPSFEVVADLPLSGAPDVIFLDRELNLLYVAIGDPGLIEVFDVGRPAPLEIVETELGAHTLGFDPDRHRVYAFLPATHRAAVFAASRPAVTE